MAGKPRSYVENEIGIRLEDYKSALWRHGIRTATGTLRWLLNWKGLCKSLGITITGGITALTGQPLWLLLGSGHFIMDTLFRLSDDHLDLQDIETQHADIAWVHEVGELNK